MPGSTIGFQVRVRVQGQLSATWWAGVFDDLVVTADPDGTSCIAGELPDQAAVHGLLAAIRDLGLTLLSVETTAVPASGKRSGTPQGGHA